MKKFVAILLMNISIAFVASAQHEEQNKAISPFADASDAVLSSDLSYLYETEAWQNFKAKYPTWGARMNPYNGLPLRAFGQPISYNSGASDVVSKATHFIEHELKAFGIPLHELKLQSARNDGQYTNVIFKQVHQGHEVMWSNLIIRFNQQLQIVMLGCEVYKVNHLNQITIDSKQAVQFANAQIVTKIIQSSCDTILKIFPYPAANGQTQFKLVYKVRTETEDTDMPGDYISYVDAQSGSVLYRYNQVESIGFQVRAGVYKTNHTDPLDSVGMPNMNVLVNNTANLNTDTTGWLSSSLNAPYLANLQMQGKFAKVYTGQSGSTIGNAIVSSVASGDTIHLTAQGNDFSINHMNVYYHTNVVHDFMKSKFPGYTGLDYPFICRVERTDGSCNAFYNGTSINFYKNGGGCHTMATIADVIYHEYGHGLNYNLYTWLGGSFDNRAMGEGYSDVWAMSITKNPLIGKGYQLNSPTTVIRKYDGLPKVYPHNINGEIHNDGEIIAGAWYDYAVNLAATNVPFSFAVDTMSSLFTRTFNGLASGPSGLEGQIYYKVLLDALFYDDDNGNIYTGTPHFKEIVKAFARHGIYLMNSVTVNHTPLPVVPLGVSTIQINASLLNVDFPAFLGDVKLVSKPYGTNLRDTILMSKSGNNLSVAITPSAFPLITEYYFVLFDIYGNIGAISPFNSQFTIPLARRNLPYYLLQGYTTRYMQDFDGSNPTASWQIGLANDNAWEGYWEIANPKSSFDVNGKICQTGADHTTGLGKCVVTDAGMPSAYAGDYDLDGGRVTFATEEFDLTTYNKPVISYWRWFTNDQGEIGNADAWVVVAKYGNSAGSTYNVERVYQSDNSWRRAIFIPNKNISNKVTLYFIANDSVTQSNWNGVDCIIEAAVDDFEIFDEQWPTNLAENTGQQFISIYPNPSYNGILYLEAPAQEACEVQILNAVGQDVYSSKLNKGSTRHSLQLNHLPSAVYTILVKHSQGVYVKKLQIN